MSDLPGFFQLLFQQGFVPAAAVALAFWNADKILSKDGAKLLYAAIAKTWDGSLASQTYALLDQLMSGYFSWRVGLIRYLWNVFVLTLVSIVVLLSIYFYTISVSLFDLFFVTITDPVSGDTHLALSGVLGQVLGNGLVVTYIVNCVVLSLFPLVSTELSSGSLRQNLFFVFLDTLAKVLLFVILEFASFALFASLGDSFNGDPVAAVLAVPPTIVEALKFRNMTAVYLYSLAISSFPLFILLMIKLLARHRAFSEFVRGAMFWLPFEDRPLRAISSVVAIFTGLFALSVSLVISVLPAAGG